MIPKLGSCYYPEHWSETQWEKDAKDMKAVNEAKESSGRSTMGRGGMRGGVKRRGR